MITSKLFLKNDEMRIQFKILIVFAFILSGLMLWDCKNIQEDIQEAKKTIYKHQQLKEQLARLKLSTTDSIITDAKGRSERGVFNNWIEVAHWVERNRESSFRYGAEYSYQIDSLINHPQGHNRTKELNIQYKFSHHSQDFEDMIRLLHQTLNDTTKALFVKELAVHGDSLGIKNSSTILGGWIQE